MALFGQTVIAELPSSVRKLAPIETTVEASFLHPGLDSGPVGQGLVRVDNELVLKRFVARNVRAILPPEWDLNFGANVFSKMDQEIEDVPPSQGVEQPRRRLRPLPEVVEEEALRPPEEDIVEYPDGAPGDLVRQMKEPDVPLPKKRSAVHSEGQSGLKLARQGPLQVRFEQDQSSGVPRVDVERETTATPSGDHSRVFPLTRHGPACQSGMVAPGIRHSAECRRLRYAFDHPDSRCHLQILHQHCQEQVPMRLMTWRLRVKIWSHEKQISHEDSREVHQLRQKSWRKRSGMSRNCQSQWSHIAWTSPAQTLVNLWRVFS